MKRLAILIFICAALTVDTAMADPFSSAMRQAHAAANGGGGAGDASPPQTPAPPQNNPPPNPALQATLQNIADLQNDFSVISSAVGTDALTNIKTTLAVHLAAAAQGAKASQTSVSKLADNLSGVIAGNEKLRAQFPKLAQFIHAGFNGSQLTDAQQKMIFDGTEKILTGAGAPAGSAAGVVEDLKTIARETK